MALSLAELETESASVLPSRDTMFIVFAGGHNRSFVFAPSSATVIAKAGISIGNTIGASTTTIITVIQG